MSHSLGTSKTETYVKSWGVYQNFKFIFLRKPVKNSCSVTFSSAGSANLYIGKIKILAK